MTITSFYVGMKKSITFDGHQVIETLIPLTHFTPPPSCRVKEVCLVNKALKDSLDQ